MCCVYGCKNLGQICLKVKAAFCATEHESFVKMARVYNAGKLYNVVNVMLQPERIDPPDPTRPDYDIRADVWSLGISLVSNIPAVAILILYIPYNRFLQTHHTVLVEYAVFFLGFHVFLEFNCII